MITYLLFRDRGDKEQFHVFYLVFFEPLTVKPSILDWILRYDLSDIYVRYLYYHYFTEMSRGS